MLWQSISLHSPDPVALWRMASSGIEKMDDLASESLLNEEYILDAPFTLEEVVFAVKSLKSAKAGGPDGMVAEHLKWGGESLHLWLTGVLN